MYCTGSEAQLAYCLAFYTQSGDSASRLCTHNEDAGVSCPGRDQLLCCSM